MIFQKNWANWSTFQKIKLIDFSKDWVNWFLKKNWVNQLLKKSSELISQKSRESISLIIESINFSKNQVNQFLKKSSQSISQKIKRIDLLKNRVYRFLKKIKLTDFSKNNQVNRFLNNLITRTLLHNCIINPSCTFLHISDLPKTRSAFHEMTDLSDSLHVMTTFSGNS